MRWLPVVLVLVGCSSTLTSIVRRDEQETRTCGVTTWVGHAVETCDLRLSWYGPPQWINCHTTLTDPFGFRATTYAIGAQ